MSTAEILEELPRLARDEREKIWKRLAEIELGEMDRHLKCLRRLMKVGGLQVRGK